MALTIDLTSVETRNALAAERAKSDTPTLVGLTREELAATLVESGLVPERQARMRAQQLWHWLYVRGVSDFDEMSNISRDLREALGRHFTVARPEIVEEQISADGTRKW
ncbi:MAG: 23S rRNA (adenine(2503)-C(2))-methyltransferase RlmN, partial [Nitratireductor sp.]